MERRSFLRNAAGTIAAVGLAGSTKAFASEGQVSNEAQFQLKYAPHLGMFKNIAGEDPIDQIKFMADQGFTAFEDNGMMGREPALQTKIGETLAALNMTMGVFVVDKGGNLANTLAAGKPEFIDIFLDGCRKAVDVAKRVNAKWMTVVPGSFERKLPIGLQDANVILEPLSDSPDLYLQTSQQTFMICKAVNSSACKILYDIYHMQKMEGNLIRNMELTWDEIGYIQIGDNPGRKEPTTGEINYKNVFKFIHDKGYQGILGMEHGISLPGLEGEKRLIAAYHEVDSF